MKREIFNSPAFKLALQQNDLPVDDKENKYPVAIEWFTKGWEARKPLLLAVPDKFLMVDVETLSLHPNAVITQIGLVRCDAVNSTIESLGSVHLNIDAQIKDGRHVSGDTIAWNVHQGNKSAIKHTTDGLPGTLTDFFEPVQPDEYIMSNGVDFDLPMLRGLHIDNSIRCRWSYKNQFCYRTLLSMVSAPANKEYMQRYHDAALAYQGENAAHDALADAIYQGFHAIGAYRLINGLEYAEIKVINRESGYG